MAESGPHTAEYSPCAWDAEHKRARHLPNVLVPGAGFEPAWPCGLGIFIPLRLSPPLSGSWSGARLRRGLATLGARRLLSTPSLACRAWLGVGSSDSSGLSPNLTGYTARISPRGLNIVKSPVSSQFHHPGSGVMLREWPSAGIFRYLAVRRDERVRFFTRLEDMGRHAPSR